MGAFKTKNCKFLTFPIAIFHKAEERDITGACISKSILPHSTENVMFIKGKVKSLVSSLLVNKLVRWNLFGNYN